MRALAFAALLLLPGVARAGSDTIDCETADKTIVMTGAGQPNRIKITTVEAGIERTHDAPAVLHPHFSGERDTGGVVIGVPLTSARFTSRKHETQHVRHKKDGKTCEGRERWDETWTQRFIFTGKGGDPLQVQLGGKVVGLMTSDGYVIAELTCRRRGYSSAGGCFAAPDDTVTWKRSRF